MQELSELKDKRELDENNEPKSEVFYSEGATEFVNYLEGSREKLIPNPIYMEGKKKIFLFKLPFLIIYLILKMWFHM